MRPDLTQPKTFPNSCSKKQLQDMYRGQISAAEIRMTVNEIIKERRKRDPRRVKLLWPDELREFVETVGLPAGYQLREKKNNLQ